jgi:hypothetical protein
MECGIPSDQSMGFEAITSIIIPQKAKHQLFTHNLIPQSWNFYDTHEVMTAMKMAQQNNHVTDSCITFMKYEGRYESTASYFFFKCGIG